MDYTEAMIALTQVIDAIGVAIIVIGGAYGLVRAYQSREPGVSYYVEARRRFGQPLLLGLEVLVASDIIATVTVDQSLESVITLGVLVLVRVVLSFSLDVEIDGMLPLATSEMGTQRRLRCRPGGGVIRLTSIRGDTCSRPLSQPWSDRFRPERSIRVISRSPFMSGNHPGDRTQHGRISGYKGRYERRVHARQPQGSAST